MNEEAHQKENKEYTVTYLMANSAQSLNES